MENDTLKKEADKVINVTYMLSGVLEQSFQEMDEETVECFDDTTLRFYVIFMKLLEVAGIDYLCDLRLYSLYNLLDKYQSLTSYPKLDSRAKIAFLQVKSKVVSILQKI